MKRRMLTAKQRFLLTNLAIEKFPASNLTYSEFAADASTTLGFTITEHNVAGVCKDFDLAPGKGRGGHSDAALEALERRIKALEDRLEVYIMGCRK